MRYMGSKKAHFEDYWPVLEKLRKPGQVWVEPMMGGCNSLDKVPGYRIGNDLHPQLVAMWRALQAGWEPPDEVSEEQYQELKRAQRVDALTGFAGFGCAFGGIYFDTYARDADETNYAAQTKRTLAKQIEKMPPHEVVFYQGSYDSFYIPPESFIYCDPPYADTASYSVGGFDHRRFWKWCNRMVAEGHTVVVAEYSAPPDWAPIWEKKVRSKVYSTKHTNSIERIFMRASAYDEDEAREYYDPPLYKLYTIPQVLRFVIGAGNKDTSSIVIANKVATVNNEIMTYEAPINVPFDVVPSAKEFAAVVKVAEESRQPLDIGLTPGGKFRVSAGKARSFVNTMPDSMLSQPIAASGVFLDNPVAIYKALVKLAPIMARDDLREFANGVSLNSYTCMATNNILFGEVWHGSELPFNRVIGADTIDQLIRLNEEPEAIQYSMNTITFWFHGRRRLTSTLINAEFPVDKVSAILNRETNFVELSAEFFAAIKTIIKLNKGTNLRIEPNRIFTSDQEEDGASVDIATGTPKRIVVKAEVIMSLSGLADRIDFSQYPDPMTFQGAGMRGLIMGLLDR